MTVVLSLHILERFVSQGQITDTPSLSALAPRRTSPRSMTTLPVPRPCASSHSPSPSPCPLPVEILPRLKAPLSGPSSAELSSSPQSAVVSPPQQSWKTFFLPQAYSLPGLIANTFTNWQGRGLTNQKGGLLRSGSWGCPRPAARFLLPSPGPTPGLCARTVRAGCQGCACSAPPPMG